MRRDPSSSGTARKHNGTLRNTLRGITAALFIAAGFILFLVVASPSLAGDPLPTETVVETSPIPAINRKTNEYRRRADFFGHKLKVHVPFAHNVVTPSTSVAYEIKRRNAWMKKSKEYEARYHLERKYALANQRFQQSLKLASKQWGVSYDWLLTCALHEGLSRPGEPWKPNASGSGAGGWMQFMKSTFYAYSGTATSMLPDQYNNWYSKLGQAYTAAYMFSIGESGQWTGAGCAR